MQEEGGPSTQQRAQTACGQGREGANPSSLSATPAKEGDPPELQCAQLVCWKRRDEITHTRQRDTPACIQGGEDEGNPPKLQCAHIVHGM